MERNGWTRVEGVTFRVERGRMLSAQRRQTGRRQRTATPLTWPAARRGARFGMVFGRAPTAGRATVGRRPRPVAGRAAAAVGAVFFFLRGEKGGWVLRIDAPLVLNRCTIQHLTCVRGVAAIERPATRPGRPWLGGRRPSRALDSSRLPLLLSLRRALPP